MQQLDDYLDQVETLPPAPRILPELMTLLQQEDVDNGRVIELISFDPGVTAGVLRVSNSACFAGATPVDSLAEAVGRLGFSQIYKLVLAATGARLLGTGQKGYGLNRGELWQHSVTAAVAAQMVARGGNADENLVFTAALLHDLGKIVLTEAIEERYSALVSESQNRQAALIELEKQLLGVQHAEIGGRLLERWNFPTTIVNAVWHHHEPEEAGADQQLASYVYLGNMIAYFMGFGYGHQPFALRGREFALHSLGLKADCLPEFMIRTFEKLREVETMVSLKS
jgi:putative nucleotidyltransferase with HDIG domain